MVIPKDMRQMPTPFPYLYDANVKCAFHDGSKGHATKNRRAFKARVQDLIDQKLLSFTEEVPNVRNSSLPEHGGQSINVVEKYAEHGLVKKLGSIRTSMAVILEKLTEYGMIKEAHDNCELCLSAPYECEELKRYLQELMDKTRCKSVHSGTRV